MKNGNLLTEGGVFRVLLKFSVPFLIVNIIQVLYGVMDLMVIDWCCVSESAATVSTGTQITQITISMVSGLTLGSMIIVERYTGMKDEDWTCKTVGTTLSVFAVMAILLTVMMLTFRGPILAALKTPAAFLKEANDYVTICFYSIFFICGYNTISVALRGYGDSRKPIYLIVLSCMLNIIGDIVLVKRLGPGVAGTILATILSQSISMICSIIYLNRNRFISTFSLKNLYIDWSLARELPMVGILVSSQECMVHLSLLYLASVTNRLGVNAATTVGIASKYGVFAMLPAAFITNALATITAHNYGAERLERARQSLAAGIGFSVLASSLFFLQAQLFPQTMIGLFNTNPDIISAGTPFFHSCSFGHLVISFVFCLNGLMNGRSKTVFTMISRRFGALTLRIPLIWLTYTYCPDNPLVIGSIVPVVSELMTVYTMGFVLRQIRTDRVTVAELRLGDSAVQWQSFPEKDSKKDSKSCSVDLPR